MKAALTIGNFDGVHRGHKALVETITEWRRAHTGQPEIRSLVLTFEPHPIEILKPGTFVPRLSTLKDKIHLLQNLGVDEVKVVPFTSTFAETAAKDFFMQHLVRLHKPAFIAVGHNFYFGHNREGTPGKIIDWAREAGISAQLVAPIEADGGIISSSRIRKLIMDGQMVPASRLLGRDYAITGEVLHGDKRGRLLGFPTANLVPTAEGIGLMCTPARGVYLSSATVEGRTFASITNVGVKPTVSQNNQLTVETHLLDFDGDLYGKQLAVEFRDRLRGEQKFNSLDELTQQIRKDINIARERLSLK